MHQVDANALIEDFASENAKTVTRALLAEAQVRDYTRIIQGQQAAIEQLAEYAPHALLVQLGIREDEPPADAEPDAEPDAEVVEIPKATTTKKPARRSAGTKAAE